MNKIKKILSYPLGFLLSVIGSLLVILFILKTSAFNMNYIKKEFEKTNYYKNIYVEITEGMKDYIAPTGLPDEVLDGIISEEDVKIEINNYLDNLSQGKTYEVNTGDIESKVEKNVEEFLKKYNVAMDSSEDFKSFVNDLKTVYTNEVKLYKVLDKFVSYYPRACNYINKFLVILSICFIIGLVLMCILNINIISSVIMSSGIILMLIRLFIIEDIDIKNITIFNDYFSVVLRNILLYFSKNLLFLGVCLLIFGFFVSLFASKRKLSLKK